MSSTHDGGMGMYKFIFSYWFLGFRGTLVKDSDLGSHYSLLLWLSMVIFYNWAIFLIGKCITYELCLVVEIKNNSSFKKTLFSTLREVWRQAVNSDYCTMSVIALLSILHFFCVSIISIWLFFFSVKVWKY